MDPAGAGQHTQGNTDNDGVDVYKRQAVTSGGMNTKQKTELKIKRALCAQGAFEGVHYSFFSPSDLNLLGLPEDAPERKAIRLINPINEDLSLMRTCLLYTSHSEAGKHERGISALYE